MGYDLVFDAPPPVCIFKGRWHALIMQSNYGPCNVYLMYAFARMLPPYSLPRINKYLERGERISICNYSGGIESHQQQLLVATSSWDPIEPTQIRSLSVCSASIWSKIGGISMYGLRRWETTLHYSIVHQWLNPYAEPPPPPPPPQKKKKKSK